MGMHAPANHGILNFHLNFAWEMTRCGHSILLAHAHTVKLYRENYKHQKGKIAMVCNIMWGEPLDTSNELDKLAAQTYMVSSIIEL